MKWFSSYKHPKNLNFIIYDHGEFGFHNCIYENPDLFAEDLKDTRSYGTRRQDEAISRTLDAAKRRALKTYGVPVDSWKETE